MFYRPIAIAAADAAAVKRNNWIVSRWPEAVAAVIALALASLYLNAVPGPDVSWQLWIAHQIRMGARLYVDIIETNPPLWFWEALPLDWASAILAMPSRVLLVATLGIATALSVWTTGSLVRQIPQRPRAALLIYAALALLLIPLVDAGQKEQIALIGALPYAMLAAARTQGHSVPRLHAIAIGVGAALGLALKHYFLIAPILIELWLLVRLKRAYRPFRPETAAMATLGLGYGGALLAITPDYLRDIVTLNRLAYSPLSAGRGEMFSPIQYYWLIALVPLLAEFRAVQRSPRVTAMAVCTCGFFLAWFVQFKGFPYHSFATTGCLVLTLALLAVDEWDNLRFATRALLPTLLVLPVGYMAWYGPYRNDFAPIVRPMLVGLRPHDSVAFISDEPVFAWPLSLYRESLYPSRHSGMWMLHAVAFDGGRTSALVQVGQQVMSETAQDYRCVQPVRIIFNNKTIEGINLEAWFQANRDFAQVMRHYRKLGSYRVFDIYQLNAPFPRPPANECRKVF